LLLLSARLCLVRRAHGCTPPRYLLGVERRVAPAVAVPAALLKGKPSSCAVGHAAPAVGSCAAADRPPPRAAAGARRTSGARCRRSCWRAFARSSRRRRPTRPATRRRRPHTALCAGARARSASPDRAQGGRAARRAGTPLPVRLGPVLAVAAVPARAESCVLQGRLWGRCSRRSRPATPAVACAWRVLQSRRYCFPGYFLAGSAGSLGAGGRASPAAPRPADA